MPPPKTTRQVLCAVEDRPPAVALTNCPHHSHLLVPPARLPIRQVSYAVEDRDPPLLREEVERLAKRCFKS